MAHVADLYAPLIERDLAAIPAAVAGFRSTSDSDELFLAIARFAVLAFAPSEHSKHALLATLAAHDLRVEYGARWDELLTECARYIAASRQPWSEPPLLDPPAVEPREARDVDALRRVVHAQDRLAGERWLAARLDDGDVERELIDVASDDLDDFGGNLVVTSAALRLSALLGEKGRFAVLRVAIWQMTAGRPAEAEVKVVLRSTRPAELLDDLIGRAVEDHGSLESVHRVLLFDAAISSGCEKALAFLGATSTKTSRPGDAAPLGEPPIYPLARDYAQTLLAHAAAKRLRARFPAAALDSFVAAAEYNREHGDSFDEWSFA